ncbi:uncharacterized protein A1O5_09409 [Cladophialophora psammophila CBS 110553]|uniref:Xylanolytic transcriptional activator regulatory domain-containing protein n=1 Tax=Cladophialophora psammophila CBS 110553 TaxID=1182543 RepID=W9WRY0_9EURO|nr:uncharacterized protein A1O5_09409 [Cladophialophora psammophila CBS 110553]EXJ67396.1 hypothetical protein A1O5_09409 [Cladophialophora psammophila CBS 110553]
MESLLNAAVSSSSKNTDLYQRSHSFATTQMDEDPARSTVLASTPIGHEMAMNSDSRLETPVAQIPSMAPPDEVSRDNQQNTLVSRADLPGAPLSTEEYPTPDKTEDASRTSPSCGFSPFSPQGIQCAIEWTPGVKDRQTLLAAAQDTTMKETWKSNFFSSSFGRRVWVQLPSKEEAMTTVEQYFRDFNSIVPLFCTSPFMALFEQQYSSNPPESAGWWASLSVVMSIALGTKPIKDGDCAAIEQARDFLRNSLAVLTELFLQSNDPWVVPALIGTALILQGTPDPRPATALLASAKSLLADLATNRRSLSKLDSSDMEHQNRLFWIAYRLDNDLRIRSGLPLSSELDTRHIELPSPNPVDQLGIMTFPNGRGNFNIFRAMAEFAVIEAAAHRELHSAKRSERSDEDLLTISAELDLKLEKWKESIPLEVQPDYDVTFKLDDPRILHVLVLHFAYHNCVQTIHRLALQHSSWAALPNKPSSEARPTGSAGQLFQSNAMISFAARASLRLLRHIPEMAFGYVWRVLFYPANAFIATFTAILQNPTGARVCSDLALMGCFVKFLSSPHNEDSPEIKRIIRVSSDFERIAAKVVERAENKCEATCATPDLNTIHWEVQGHRVDAVPSAEPLAFTAAQEYMNEQHGDGGFLTRLDGSILVSDFSYQPYSSLLDEPFEIPGLQFFHGDTITIPLQAI